jgi:hypothetical protein
MADDQGRQNLETRAQLLRAVDKLASIAQSQGQESRAFRQAQEEVQDLIQRLGGIERVMSMDELDDDFTESIVGDDELWEEEFSEPTTPIVELLPDLAQVGVTVSRILDTLESWANWLADDEDARSDLLSQAHRSLLEADGAVHATAAMLHLYMTGAPPPGELFEEDGDEEES